MNKMTEEQKAFIDSASYEDLLRHRELARPGDPFFIEGSEVDTYYKKAMAEKAGEKVIERVCGTCAWGVKAAVLGPFRIECMYEPVTIFKRHGDFCHHHATTRGWRDDKPREAITYSYAHGYVRVRNGGAFAGLKQEPEG